MVCLFLGLFTIYRVRQLKLNVVYVINISSNSKCKSIIIRAYTKNYRRGPVEYLNRNSFCLSVVGKPPLHVFLSDCTYQYA